MTEDESSAAYRGTRNFIDEHPEAESDFERLLAVDAERETWTFDDVPLDSGRFGEVVSKDIVEKRDGGYRVVDPEAVRAALDGSAAPISDDNDAFELDFTFDFDSRSFGGLIAALLAVVAARLTQYQSVFQSGHVVSPGNDQYFYRYWMERLLADSTGPLDFGVVARAPWGDYAQGWNERPLTHATNWFVAELLGGTQWAADTVTAWLPIVLTIALALVLYKLSLELTDDARVGIASVLFLALTPIHVGYTQVGWLGNRPHQYLWFGVVLLGLVQAARVGRQLQNGTANELRQHLRSVNGIGPIAVLGIGVAFWTHSWAGSAALFVPLLGYAGLRVLLDVRDGVSPGYANFPLLLGLGLGAFLAVALHLVWDWHGIMAIGAVTIGFLGTGALVGVGEFWHRTGRSAATLLASQVALAIVGVLLLALVRPELAQTAVHIATTVPFGGQSVQSQSLFGPSQGVFLGPLAQIGLPFLIAVAMLVWFGLIVATRYEPELLVLGVFGVAYLLAAALMVRFAAKFVIATAPLVGFGIVRLLSIVDLTRRPALRGVAADSETVSDIRESPSNRQRWRIRSYIAAVGIVLFGLNLLFISTLTGQQTHDAHFEAAIEISDHAEQTDRDYPENHVFAPWAEYRMYNYFVSGQSESEDVGRHHYDSIYSSTGIGYDTIYSWLGVQHSFNGIPKGYMVVENIPIETPNNSLHSKLYPEPNDSNLIGAPDYYKLIHADRNARIFVYAVVPGADLRVSGPRNESVAIEQDVAVSGHNYIYSRQATTGENGEATIPIVYPGEYNLGDTIVSITDEQIQNGATIDVALPRNNEP